MIISCEKCKKKFEVNENLIPSNGRYLQCSSCSHKWFFKKNEQVLTEKKKDKLIKKIVKKKTTEDSVPEDVEKIISDAEVFSIDKEKKTEIGILSLFKILIITIITFSAFIIILDTFKSSFNDFFPGLNSLLDDLYDSLKDLFLFFKDLIR